MDTGSEKLSDAVQTRHPFPANMQKEDLADFEAGASYSTFGGRLQYVGKAGISPESVIYKNGVLLRDSLALPGQATYYQYRHQVKKLLFSPKIRLARGKKYLLVTDSWSSGHFHWIADVLPKLILVKDKAAEFVLLLPDLPYIRTVGLESLDILGIRFEEVVLMRPEAFYKADELYYIPAITISGQFDVSLMKQLKNALCDQLRPGTKRIYISRSKAAVRKVLNENELIPFLHRYGFEILNGEDYNLKEQARLFSEAGILMGIHGAGLANCIFMQEGSKLIELRKKENGPLNVGYWHLADAVGQKYYYFNGKPDSNLPLVGSGCNLTIDPGILESVILNHIA
ncbi:MAG: glycosyltransferase family 61 protein [Sphingobacteriales bacterium]|nr:glycosyltransferase family 61 protein [Sphingobacteriales bacterium]